MSEDRIPFLAQAKVLERIIKSPANDQLDSVKSLIVELLEKSETLRSHFFRSQPHHSWASVLLKNQFFSKAPVPIVLAEGASYPFWDAQQYLIAISRYVPDILVQHIQLIEGHDWYRGRALWGLHELPKQYVSRALPTVLEWLRNRQRAEIIADDAFQLMISLAKSGNPSSFSLFKALTKPYRSKQRKQFGRYVIGRRVDSVLADSRWLYASENVFGTLNKIDPLRTARILELHLRRALSLEVRKGEPAVVDLWWRRHGIEGTGDDDFRDVLLEGLRDSLVVLTSVDQRALKEILNRFKADGLPIFKRLRLHLLSTFPEILISLLEAELVKSKNYDAPEIHHEFFLSLERGFPLMKRSTRQKIVKIILAGPSRRKVTDFAKWMASDAGAEAENAYIESFMRRWVRDRLHVIQAHLPGEAAEVYADLVQKEGRAQNPANTGGDVHSYRVLDSSPLSPSDLQEMSAEELVTFLLRWQPEGDQVGPNKISYRGLASVVAASVRSNPDKYASCFTEIAMMRPEYAYSFCQQRPIKISEDDTVASPIPLSFFLDLFERILANDDLRLDMSRTSHIGWSEVRRGIVGFIESLYRDEVSDETTMGKSEQDRLRDLLILLLEDPDPTDESDRPAEGWVGHRDPTSVAINHVRSNALLTLINGYAFRIAEAEQASGRFKEFEGPGPNRIESKVQDAIDRKLRRQQDPSWAVHSIFGRTLVTLYWLNKGWVEEHLDEIFPMDVEGVEFFMAAWDSYVIFNLPYYQGLFDLLRQKYLRAIENHNRGLVIKTHLEPKKSLARHLVGEYLFGHYDIKSTDGQNSLIALFFEDAPPDSRGIAVWLIWRHFEENPKASEHLWERAKVFWRWRVDLARNSNYASDFDNEMAWFPNLLRFAPPSESIVTLWDLLEGILPYLHHRRGFDRGWEQIEAFLVREVHAEPLRAIEYYRLMNEQVDLPRLRRQSDDSKRILEIAAEKKVSRDAALSLIDLLSSRGDLRFLELYSKYAH